MGQFGYKQFSERHRPHIHPPGSILFVTYRLAGSIPQATVRQYKAMKQWLDEQLDRVKTESLRDDAPELQNWLERVEKFSRDWFVKFENILHTANFGPMWMQDDGVAAKVSESLSQLGGKAYRLDA